jgi:ribose transport system permease protein
MKVFLDLEARTGSTALASLGAVGAGVASGGLAGLLNGLAVTKLKVSPFVVTLGMLSLARGLAVWLAERRVVAFDRPPPEWVRAFGRIKHDLLFFDPGVWSVVLLALLMTCVMHLTVFGRYCYVLGANEQTARRCGIPIDGTRLWVYFIAGLLVGWAGILRFAHGSAGDPNTGEVLALDVIAAVVIGGASLSGGSGTVAGTMLGVLILGVLDNGVSFCNVPIEVKYVLIGAVVIANTALSQWQRRRLA